jgi:hypothetical protein
MHAHRAPTEEAADRARAVLQSFLTAYRAALGSDYPDLFGSAGIRESATHFGAEVLVRTVGAFQGGYLYEGLEPSDGAVQEAIQVAADHIRHPGSANALAHLN